MSKPNAFANCIILPILASLLLLGLLALRFHAVPTDTITLSQQQHKKNSEHVAFVPLPFPDKRGWLMDPVAAAAEAGLSGGAISCEGVHVGEIKPRGVRANHRHRSCNETFIIWGAKTLFRFEDSGREKGYGEVLVGAEDVVVATSPRGRAHALANVDHTHSTYFLGCQDAVLNFSNPDTDFHIWKDL
uniref:Cupin type-1 domain-containing protein n=1 Tax=Picea sitchensis TaxID=3332 RepID=D5AC34_PICSI|nr:unknown [Picea sitchensis]